MILRSFGEGLLEVEVDINEVHVEDGQGREIGVLFDPGME